MKELPLTLEGFRDRARQEFAFLVRRYGFHEMSIPYEETPYLNPCAVWFTSATTRILIEGINYGANTRIALGGVQCADRFENYDLRDLIAVRLGLPVNDDDYPRIVGSQAEQLNHYAVLLPEIGDDVLRGDHSVFSALAARVEWRRTEFAARRDPRVPPKPPRKSIVSKLVREEVRRRFGDRAPELVRRLGATALPLLEGADRARDRNRVQLAILKLAERDPERTWYHLEIASRDWRDTLVAAGLANADWPDVLKREGFPDLNDGGLRASARHRRARSMSCACGRCCRRRTGAPSVQR